MPFRPVEQTENKCPKCGKSVYAAEERLGGAYKFHKQCFKCENCNKLLDSTNCAPHEAKLYCKICHKRKFGPKGYGFGCGGAGLGIGTDPNENLDPDSEPSSNTWQAPNTRVIMANAGEGCPRCGGAVYEAEKMLAGGRPWHKTCFKCNACTKQLDSTNSCDGPDKDIYCRSCYAKHFGPKGYGFGQGAGCLQSDESILNGDQYLSNKPHLITNTRAIMANEGEGCPRCGGQVYAAEEVLAKGRKWHRRCFHCSICNKHLDSINACDGPDSEIYCTGCYAKKYGPKGYGFACGSGFLLTDLLPNDENDTQRPNYTVDCSVTKPTQGQEGCPRCGGAVYAAEKMLAKGAAFHKKCFTCAMCRRPLDSVLACDGPDKEIYDKPCYAKKFGPKGYGYGYSPTLVTVGESTAPLPEGKIGGEKPIEGEGCPRCGFAVYAAEQMLSRGRLWHRRCFSCNECHKSLDSMNCNDAPDAEIYCRSCYGRKFGPKGVGYGLGAGTLTMS